MAVLPGAEESRAFAAAQGVDAPPDALAPELAALIDQAAASWPDIDVDRIAFAGFLGRRVPSDVDSIEALRGMAVGELYLAHACLAGHPVALQRFDEAYVSGLAGVLARQGFDRSLVDEIVQGVRLRLFTGERPALLAYGGIGSLKGWLRVTALRQALRAQRKERAFDAEEVTEALADAAADPGLHYERRLYQEEFRTAFQEAIASLSVRERNLLRQSVLHGATADDLGALYKVHRATAARWVAQARQRLAGETRQRMLKRLKIRPADFESILKVIHSQLDVSIERALRDD